MQLRSTALVFLYYRITFFFFFKEEEPFFPPMFFFFINNKKYYVFSELPAGENLVGCGAKVMSWRKKKKEEKSCMELLPSRAPPSHHHHYLLSRQNTIYYFYLFFFFKLKSISASPCFPNEGVEKSDDKSTVGTGSTFAFFYYLLLYTYI